MLVTLQEAKDHLRIDNNDDDNDLTLKVEAASQFILNYIASDLPFFNSAGIPDYDTAGVALDIPYPIKAATLIVLGTIYKDRDGEQYNEDVSRERLGNLILPRSAHFLLDPYREVICE